MKRFFLIGIISGLFLATFGQTRQIDRLQKQRKSLQLEIETTNKLYVETRKEASTILHRIGLINKQIEARKQLITVQNNEVTALEKEQANLQQEIVTLNQELEKKKENYNQAIHGMLNRKASQNQLLFVLSGKSFGESLRRLQYLKKYAQWRKSQAEEIKNQQTLIQNKNVQLQQSKNDKLQALSNLQNDQRKLESEEKVRQSEMAEARGKQKELQKTLQQKRQEANKLNAQIENLIKEEIARQKRLEEERRRAEQERIRKAREAEEARKREAERLAQQSQSKPKKPKKSSKKTPKTEQPIPAPIDKTPPREEIYVAAADEFKLSSNFESNKGRLPMPVTGAASIVSSFGVNHSNEWSHVSTNNSGVDIQAQPGASVRSVFDGEVTKVFASPGSNTCVIIRHGKFFTFYGNIINIAVKNGDKVKSGQALGRIFTDPDTGTARMHFQVWQGFNKLNPATWLRR